MAIKLQIDPAHGGASTTTNSRLACGYVTGEPGLSITILGGKPWDDQEFDEFIELILEVGKRQDLAPNSIVFSGSQAATAAQRRRLSERVKSRNDSKTAIVTASAAARVSLNALAVIFRLRRLGGALRAFSPDTIDEAFAWLNVSVDQQQSARHVLAESMSAVGYPPATFLPKILSARLTG